MSDLDSIMPAADAVAEMLRGLLDCEVAIEAAEGIKPSMKEVTVVSEYLDDDGQTVIVSVSDFELASTAGAVLMAMSPEAAEESKQSCKLQDEVAEGYREIMNIAASLFNEHGQAHFKLIETYLTPRPLPARIVHAVMRPASRADFKVRIHNHGVGRISFVAASVR